jgi:hypothetical protein
MGRAGNVRIGKDGEELRRGSAEDSGSVDVAHGAGERGRHRLQRFFRGSRAIGFDQQNTEVALIAMRTSQLVFEDGPHKTVVEEARRAIDYVQRLRLRIVDLDSAGRTEDSAVWQR